MTEGESGDRSPEASGPSESPEPDRSHRSLSLLGRTWALRRRRPRTVALAGVVLLAVLADPFVDLGLRHLRTAGRIDWVEPFHFNDFAAYAGASARWESGRVVYWKNGDSYFATYLYPPAYVPLFDPFVDAGPALVGPFPFVETANDAGGLAWELASIAVLWVGLQAVAAELGVALRWYERLLGLWALVGFFPLLFSVKLGQVSAFLSGLFCLAFVAAERAERADRTGRVGGGGDDGDDGGRGAGAGGDGGNVALRIASGALTAVAAGMKPPYATGGAHLLRDRDRFVGAVGAVVLVVGLSLATFGVDDHLAYLDVLAWGKGWGTSPTPPYLWHPGYYAPLYPVATRLPELAVVLRVGLVAGVAGLSLLARDRPRRRETFALGVAAFPLAAPVAYTQDFVVLLLAAALLLAVELDREDGRPWLPVLAVGLLHAHAYGLLGAVWVAESLAFETWWVVSLVQPGAWGNLLLVGLAAHRTAEGLNLPLAEPIRRAIPR